MCGWLGGKRGRKGKKGEEGGEKVDMGFDRVRGDAWDWDLDVMVN